MTPERNERPAVAPANFGQFESHDVDEYTQLVQPWDIRLNQLSRGEFSGTMQAVSTPGMIIYQERWRRQAEVRGATPSGHFMFGVHLGRRSHFEFCGKALDPSRIACTGPATDFSFTAPERSHHAVVLVQPELLARGLGKTWVDRVCANRHLALPASASDRLATAIIGVVRLYAKHPERLENPSEARSIEAMLFQALSRCIGIDPAEEEMPSVGRRVAAVRDAIECIERRLGRMTAFELAIAAGVSQRTLENAFREQLGTTPGAYIRVFRLNAARRALANAESGSTTVGRIAWRWGFRQPGRFSVLYREQFGEPPSWTLRRSPPAVSFRLLDLVPGQ